MFAVPNEHGLGTCVGLNVLENKNTMPLQ